MHVALIAAVLVVAQAAPPPPTAETPPVDEGDDDAPPAAAAPAQPPPTTTAQAESSAKLSVLVLDFSAAPADAPLAAAAVDIVADALSGVPRMEVQTTTDVKRMVDLEAERQVLACDVDRGDCLAEIAGALGADLIAYGAISRVGGGIVANVTLYDARASKPVGRRAIETRVDDELPPLLRRAVQELAAPYGAAVEPPPPDPLWIGGLATLGAGVAGAAAFGAGAVVADLVIGDPTGARTTKDGARVLGIAALVGAGVGVVAAVVGGALATYAIVDGGDA